MENIIIVVLVISVVVLAAFYIYKCKKKGNKCIGCPNSSCCGAHQTKESFCESRFCK